MPACLICNGHYEPSERPFGPAPDEPCACGTMASKHTVQEMGVDWFVRKVSEWVDSQKPEPFDADDEANERADHAIDERGSER